MSVAAGCPATGYRLCFACCRESVVVPPFHTWCHTKRYVREMRYLSHMMPAGSQVPGGSSVTALRRRRHRAWRWQRHRARRRDRRQERRREFRAYRECRAHRVSIRAPGAVASGSLRTQGRCHCAQQPGSPAPIGASVGNRGCAEAEHWTARPFGSPRHQGQERCARLSGLERRAAVSSLKRRGGRGELRGRWAAADRRSAEALSRESARRLAAAVRSALSQ